MMDVSLVGLSRLSTALGALKVRHYVGGGLAAATWGQSRFTEDVDLVLDLRPDQAEALKRELGPEFEVDELSLAEAARLHRSDNIFYLTDFTRFDLYIPYVDAFTDSQFRRVRRIPFGSGVEIPVASPEDTLLSKLVWYDKGQRASAKQWSDIEGIITLRGPELDGAYLEQWAEKLGVRALLDQARSGGAPHS